MAVWIELRAADRRDGSVLSGGEREDVDLAVVAAEHDPAGLNDHGFRAEAAPGMATATLRSRRNRYTQRAGRWGRGWLAHATSKDPCRVLHREVIWRSRGGERRPVTTQGEDLTCGRDRALPRPSWVRHDAFAMKILPRRRRGTATSTDVEREAIVRLVRATALRADPTPERARASRCAARGGRDHGDGVAEPRDRGDGRALRGVDRPRTRGDATPRGAHVPRSSPRRRCCSTDADPRGSGARSSWAATRRIEGRSTTGWR